ncbi:MAG: winged helix DNA-binding protein [Gemmatimonadales bacterium]|jgi:DNA-binding MarR family transcriptional regulator
MMEAQNGYRRTWLEAANDLVGSTQIFASTIDALIQGRLAEGGDPLLTLGQLKLLQIVDLVEAPTLSDVARLLDVSPAAASKAVDRLVGRNLLHRNPAEMDRRALHLSLTDEGKCLLEEYAELKKGMFSELFEGRPKSELRQIADFLDRLSVQLIAWSNDPPEKCMRCGIYFRRKCVLRERFPHACPYHASWRRANSSEVDGPM